MAVTNASILERAQTILQDVTGVRWPVKELVRWLNDAQREVVMYRPDSIQVTEDKVLAAGTRQTLPAGRSKLIDVVHNNAGTKKAVRRIAREVLDAQVQSWHSVTAAAEVIHFMYDVRDPQTFWVYPPANGTTASVKLICASYPTPLSESVADGAAASSISGDLSVPDTLANAVLDFMLYRAYGKDSEYAGNANRAQTHYNAFANALGVEIKATVAVQPQSPGNPNLTGNGQQAAG